MYNNAKINGVDYTPIKLTKLEIIQACFKKYGYHVESLHQRFLTTKTDQFFENPSFYYCFTYINGNKMEVRFWKHSKRCSEFKAIN
jgi:hypothetical protein